MERGPGQARLRILVVDDDRFMLDMLPMWLTRAFAVSDAPPDIQTARSPQEALLLLDGSCTDVVLSDYDLRDSVNGVKLLEEVRARCPETIRILFSGHAPDEIGDDLQNRAIHGFIEKPMRIQEMIAPLRAIVERHRAAST